LTMELEITTPMETTYAAGISAIYAEGANGPFTILPRHADYAACLAPSILLYRAGGRETFWGLDEGVLTKVGSKVCVSCRRAMTGASLAELKRRIDDEFKLESEEEKKTRGVLAALEGNIAKLFAELRNG